ncbi:MAG: hypothetical protein R2844_14270 [Caldilineales bacterium]
MDDQPYQPDEALEVREYLEAAELEAARQLEVAEFIRDLDLGEDEENDGGGGELQDAPVAIIEDARARRTYWQAQSLVELEQDDFAAALAEGDDARQRSAYFRLAVYHGRTIYILRSALNGRKEALAQAAMRNLGHPAPRHDADAQASAPQRAAGPGPGSRRA